MQTQCTSRHLEFEGLGRREVVANFDGGRMTSDGGAALLREADLLYRVSERLAACFVDHRSPERIEHSLQGLVAQRTMAIALGYEDINDHERLRDDPVLALACGCSDVTGATRARKRDTGHALAGPSTLNRLELGRPDKAEKDRYRKIVADQDAIDRLQVALFLEAHDEPPEAIVLDVDTTDDALHGGQEGRFFHGYYGHYCYLPLYITCDKHVLCSRLRTADSDAAEGALDEIKRVVGQVRAAWPSTRITLRGDSGFCRDAIMSWCEAENVDYVLGLARNSRLTQRISKAMHKSRRRCAVTKEASTRFRDFVYRTRTSWSRSRRVVGKAEWLPGPGGANPRFVVTNIDKRQIRTKELYKELYCGRGDMENRIKDQQLWLFSDRTSSNTMRANQLRVYFSAFAGTLMQIVQRIGLRGTALSKARIDTVRSRLLKLAGRVTVSVRRIRLSFASAFPMQEVYRQALANLRAAAMRAPPASSCVN